MSISPLNAVFFYSSIFLTAVLSQPVLAEDETEQSGLIVEYGDDGSCVESTLEASQQTVICIGAEIYGSYSHILVENDVEGTDHTLTQYEATPVLQVALPEKNGWVIRGKYEWESTKEGSETTAAFVALRHEASSLGVRAGLFEVGGIDQGNEYMTNLGEDAVGDYGNIAESQPYLELSLIEFDESLLLALAYSADLDEVTTENREFVQKASNINAVLEWEFEDFVLATEYEYFKYDVYSGAILESDPLLDSETAVGISASFEFYEQYTPFFSYGFSELNAEEESNAIKKHELNVGIDVEINDQWAFTVGGESIRDDRKIDDKASDDIHNFYAGVHYRINSSYVGMSVWHSDQKENQDNENIKTRVDFELGLVF